VERDSLSGFLNDVKSFGKLCGRRLACDYLNHAFSEETMSHTRFRFKNSPWENSRDRFTRPGDERNIYPAGAHEESDFSFGSDYVRDERAYRPSRLSHQSGSRSWIGVGESSFSGDQGGRSYSSSEYNENPSYADENYGETSVPRQSFAGLGPQGYRRSDERITEDINEHLTQAHDVDATGISVECKEGEVVLKGTVADRESKRCAEDIAESCFGVKDVQNQLRIQRQDFGEPRFEAKRTKAG
jgi:hypothetical protein